MRQKNARYYLIKNQAVPYAKDDKVLPKMSESLGSLILRRMKDLNISSKAELARKVKISPAYAGDLINDRGKTKSGNYKPRKEVLERLAEVLQVSLSEIFNALGYSSINGESFEVLDGVLVRFDEKKLTKAERDEIIEVIRTVIAVVEARKRS